MFKLSYKNYNTSFLSIAKRHLRTSIPFLNCKKILNIILALIERSLSKTKLKSKPYFIKIEPTNICNLRCKGCLHANGRNEFKTKGILGQIDFSIFKKIINELEQYLVKVSLYSMGEPLIYPKIIQMIKYLTQRKIGSTISSNLNYLPIELAQNLIKNQLTHLIISLDGPNKKIYNYYRIGGDFEKVVNNVKLLVYEKKRLKSKYPLIEIQMIRFKHTKDKDIARMQQFVKKIGADRLTLKNDITPSYNKPNPITSKCFWLYGNPSISWDGYLEPCCNFYKHDNQSFGNVSTNSIAKIYNNPNYQNARKYFKTGEKGKKHINCYNCSFFKSFKKTRKDE